MKKLFFALTGLVLLIVLVSQGLTAQTFTEDKSLRQKIDGFYANYEYVLTHGEDIILIYDADVENTDDIKGITIIESTVPLEGDNRFYPGNNTKEGYTFYSYKTMYIKEGSPGTIAIMDGTKTVLKKTMYSYITLDYAWGQFNPENKYNKLVFKKRAARILYGC